MFSHYFTRESQTARVEIHDYDPEALLLMIQWFYSGQLMTIDPEIRQRFLVSIVRIFLKHFSAFVQQRLKRIGYIRFRKFG